MRRNYVIYCPGLGRSSYTCRHPGNGANDRIVRIIQILAGCKCDRDLLPVVAYALFVELLDEITEVLIEGCTRSSTKAAPVEEG